MEAEEIVRGIAESEEYRELAEIFEKLSSESSEGFLRVGELMRAIERRLKQIRDCLHERGKIAALNRQARKQLPVLFQARQVFDALEEAAPTVEPFLER